MRETKEKIRRVSSSSKPTFRNVGQSRRRNAKRTYRARRKSSATVEHNPFYAVIDFSTARPYPFLEATQMLGMGFSLSDIDENDMKMIMKKNIAILSAYKGWKDKANFTKRTPTWKVFTSFIREFQFLASKTDAEIFINDDYEIVFTYKQDFLNSSSTMFSANWFINWTKRYYPKYYNLVLDVMCLSMRHIGVYGWKDNYFVSSFEEYSQAYLEDPDEKDYAKEMKQYLSKRMIKKQESIEHRKCDIHSLRKQVSKIKITDHLFYNYAKSMVELLETGECLRMFDFDDYDGSDTAFPSNSYFYMWEPEKPNMFYDGIIAHIDETFGNCSEGDFRQQIVITKKNINNIVISDFPTLMMQHFNYALKLFTHLRKMYYEKNNK